MNSSVPLLWLPAGLGAGVLMGWVAPLPFALPLWVLLIVHAVVIFHLALALPLMSLGRVTGQARVWRALVAINVLAVPLLAFILSRVVWHTAELQVGLLLVLLAPGVALILPIIRGAGGDAESVLGVTPLLLAGQLIVVPPLTILLSGGVFQWSDIPPTLLPIVGVIVTPVIISAVIQWRWKRRDATPELVLLPRLIVWWGAFAFFVTAWDKTPGLAERLSELSWLVPLSIAFLVLMAPLSLLAAGLVGVTVDKRRAILIAAVGRGGLVILPITLALDQDIWGLVPFVVMGQASIEAIGLLVYRSITREILAGENT